MHKVGYKVNDDLSRFDEQYNGIEDYRRMMNHVEHHLFSMQQVPIDVEEEKFEPKFVKYY